MTTLTKKQETFCNEFIIDLNGSAAARRAGYSVKTANAIASENLSKPDIQRRIFDLQRERAERCELTADEVIGKLRAIADAWKDNPAAGVRALELLGKHLGLFERDNAQTKPIFQPTIVTFGLSAEVVKKMNVQQSEMQPNVS